jgi:hypothetical protein
MIPPFLLRVDAARALGVETFVVLQLGDMQDFDADEGHGNAHACPEFAHKNAQVMMMMILW